MKVYRFSSEKGSGGKIVPDVGGDLSTKMLKTFSLNFLKIMICNLDVIFSLCYQKRSTSSSGSIPSCVAVKLFKWTQR